MPDIVTDEERALINAALEQGVVKQIPIGVSSYAGYRWCEKTRRVVQVEARPIHEQYNGTFSAARNRMNDNRAKAAEVRKTALLALLGDNKPYAEIAGILSVNVRTVVKLVRQLKDEGRWAGRVSKSDES